MCKKLGLGKVKYLPQSYATKGARILARQPDSFLVHSLNHHKGPGDRLNIRRDRLVKKVTPKLLACVKHLNSAIFH